MYNRIINFGKKALIFGLAMLVLGCSPLYTPKQIPHKKSYWHVVHGEVLDDKLIPYEKPGMPNINFFLGDPSTKGKGNYTIWLKADDGRKMKFWDYGTLKRLKTIDDSINSGDYVKIIYAPGETPGSGYLYKDIEKINH